MPYLGGEQFDNMGFDLAASLDPVISCGSPNDIGPAYKRCLFGDWRA